MTPPVHFVPRSDGLHIYHGGDLVAVIVPDLLPALILDAATVLRERPPPVLTIDA